MLGLFGDVLLRTPIIRSIKQSYPNSRITVLVDPIGKNILLNNPFIDDIIVAERNKKNRLKYVLSKINVQIKMIKGRFDLIIDLYNSKSSKNIIKFAFSKYRIGFYNNTLEQNLQKSEYVPYLFKNSYHLTNQLFKYLSVLNLDLSKFNFMPEFFIDSNVEQNLQFFMDSIRDKNYYLISLGSGGIEKILDLEKTYSYIAYLKKKYNFSPMIVKNPGQEFLQENLINNYLMPNNISYYELDKKTIDEIAVIIKHSKFFIVPDTGLFHLSLALKTPTFCIFTYTNPKLVEPDETVIYKACFKYQEPFIFDRDGLKLCTKEIDIDDINKALDDFINKLINN